MAMLTWVLRPIAKDPEGERVIFHPEQYVTSCVDKFLKTYTPRQQSGILASLYDLPGIRFNGKRWIEGEPHVTRHFYPTMAPVQERLAAEAAKREQEARKEERERPTCQYCGSKIPRLSMKSHAKKCRAVQRREQRERERKRRLWEEERRQWAKEVQAQSGSRTSRTPKDRKYKYPVMSEREVAARQCELEKQKAVVMAKYGSAR
jgi:hypothetical protein